MGEFQLRITSQAARDLQEIVTYIARDNPAAAERFGLALVEKAELLKTFPMLGKKVKGTEDRVLVQVPVLIFLSTGHCRRRDRNQTLLARCARNTADLAAAP
jgi:toxin ParE1/3/4